LRGAEHRKIAVFRRSGARAEARVGEAAHRPLDAEVSVRRHLVDDLLHFAHFGSLFCCFFQVFKFCLLAREHFVVIRLDPLF